MAENPFGPILEALARGEPLHGQQQMALVDLSRREAPDFQAAWSYLEEAQRLAVLDALVELAEENLRLDFRAVYRSVLHDPAPAVRAAAIRAALGDDNVELLETLIELFERDPEPQVRSAAAEALGPFACMAELGDLDERSAEQVHTVLLRGVRNTAEQVEVRAAALGSLGYFSRPQTQAEIELRLGEAGMEQAAVQAMGRSADPRWLGELLDYTARHEPELREEAARALGELEQQEALPRLVEMVDDPSASVRTAALHALGAIGGDEAREALLYAAESPDEATAATAREALETLEFFEDPMSL